MFRVQSDNTIYTKESITALYEYQRTSVSRGADGSITVKPVSHSYKFRTKRVLPKVGLMMVGLGGNNGSTVSAGILANRQQLRWRTKDGEHAADYTGSLTQASTVRVGNTAQGEEVYIPFKDVLPMVNPNDFVVSGWDINGMDLASAMERAKVLDYDLQRQLVPLMKSIRPLPSIYYPDFIASNQSARADNVLKGSRACVEHLEQLRADIRAFKKDNGLDKVIVLWTANTERFCEVTAGVHDSEANLMKAIRDGHSEVPPSQVFAMAALLEGCSYINGSPQNTFVPAIVEAAEARSLFIAGDDFKSGQTKIKSVLVDFLVSAGIKPESIVSYNHLGNNDGKNLSEARQFRSKEISKSNVVDDMVSSNGILYGPEEHPDHTVVIKYVPYVGDSKRAMDEYTSSIFLNGRNTIVMHNTCEDSLLAAPLILDLAVLTELFERIEYATPAESSELIEGRPSWTPFRRMDAVLSLLAYLLKAPKVPTGTPVVNALFKQRAAIVNVMRACVGECWWVVRGEEEDCSGGKSVKYTRLPPIFLNVNAISERSRYFRPTMLAHA
eukprot:306320_1